MGPGLTSLIAEPLMQPHGLPQVLVSLLLTAGQEQRPAQFAGDMRLAGLVPAVLCGRERRAKDLHRFWSVSAPDENGR